jgi:hypothetical protein
MSAKSFIGVVPTPAPPPIRSHIMNIQPDDRHPNPHPKERKKLYNQNDTTDRKPTREKDSGYKTRYNNDDAVKTQEEQEKKKKQFGRHNSRPTGHPPVSQTIITPSAPKASPAPRKETTHTKKEMPCRQYYNFTFLSYTSRIVCTGVWTWAWAWA